MSSKLTLLAFVAGFSSIHSSIAQAADPALTEIIVLGSTMDDHATATVITLDSTRRTESAPDAANVVARAPGAAINANGPLSGQVQYHGVFGDRVLTQVNGQRFGSGGPNLMDPPLHYAPAILLDHIELDRSVSPVRKGPGLGGGVNAVLKAPRFADTPGWAPQADISALFRSVDNSYAVGGLTGLASEAVRVGVIAAYENGDDRAFPGGRVAATSFERWTFGAEAGARTGDGAMTLSYRRQETKPSGNAPFPMDIIYFNTDFLRFGYGGNVSDGVALEFHAGHVAVRHLMDNHSLRQPPASTAQYRATYAAADTFTVDAAVRIGSDDRHVRIGADYESGQKNARITNPNNAAFFLTSLRNVRSIRWGGFVEWRGVIGPMEGELGARIDRHTMHSGAPELGSAVSAAPRTLAAAFMARTPRWNDTAFDLVARIWSSQGNITPRLTLARKTRAPNAVERFSWLATEASGGMADGNIYVGDRDLKMETAWIAEAGFDWASNGIYARPTIFYRRIEDYVQGVSFDATPGVINSPTEMVASMNGDATPLRFANVDAEIWGADIAFGAQISGPLRLDGVASYVRGKRSDISDNLYRIAPPNARVMLAWEAPRWKLGIEGIVFARQGKVGVTNSEQPTRGYFIANMTGRVSIAENMTLDAGIENLFDRYFVEHLAGYNRVAGSDVATGARIPGPGRSAFVRIGLLY